jgi:hypothetical protein
MTGGESAIPTFKIVYNNLPGGNEENYQNPSEQYIPGSEPGTS